jgi:hypothetical protein
MAWFEVGKVCVPYVAHVEFVRSVFHGSLTCLLSHKRRGEGDGLWLRLRFMKETATVLDANVAPDFDLGSTSSKARSLLPSQQLHGDVRIICWEYPEREKVEC